MPRRWPLPLALGALFGLAACGGDSDAPPPTTTVGAGGGSATFDFGLPPGVPRPRVPADNPMSAAKVALGRHLFHDVRLSGNGTQSCASCHLPELAFTDGRATSKGSTGDSTPRGAMSIVNVGYLTTLTWSNPALVALEDQAMVPMFGESPVELGLAGKEGELLAKLAAEPRYPALFAEAFPDEAEPISVGSIVRAIAAFERTVLSFSSPYDRYAYGGDPDALSPAAVRGRDLFFSERLECFHCHGGFNLSDSTAHEGTTIVETMFHNTGLYDIDGKGAYPPLNTGLFEHTGVPTDMGRFRAPTLRNIALTAPYMHDGSIATLDEVLDHYAAGGRTIASGPYAGNGAKNPFKSEFVRGFTLTAEERKDLLAFLDSLTDPTVATRPELSDPWSSP